MRRGRSCIFNYSRAPRIHVEPQRSCAAVKLLISLFCQTSESIISYTNGLNYDQMSWVTCCHETPCESCFIRSQHVLLSAKPCLLALSEGSSRPQHKSPLLILRITFPTEFFYLKIASAYISTRQEGLTHFQTSFATALSHTLFDSRYMDVLLSTFRKKK